VSPFVTSTLLKPE